MNKQELRYLESKVDEKLTHSLTNIIKNLTNNMTESKYNPFQTAANLAMQLTILSIAQENSRLKDDMIARLETQLGE